MQRREPAEQEVVFGEVKLDLHRRKRRLKTNRLFILFRRRVDE